MTSQECRWQTALDTGAFGVWDLDPGLEMVHYSPQWKARLGFPDIDDADSTSFWRCRVHPQDLKPMMDALRQHLDGYTPTYEMRFRLRSTGGGYRQVLSRGRVAARDHRGTATRMVGTMIDLCDRPGLLPVAPPPPLADGAFWRPPSAPAGVPLHRMLGVGPASTHAGAAFAAAGDAVDARGAMLALMEDLLDLAVRRCA
ncbi:PAS domain-containing protein [Aquabacterium humicola]|uniref:PAS domain-containing protein n=1 Tax=Aquabacterium humicola TaxID=3237377 RepID=UPI002542B845|nr:PAS domain-containing protein [Rubrivivax pictus]